MDMLGLHPKVVPLFLLGAGVALIMVPKWLRWGIAIVMIGLGLAGLFPSLVETPQQ